MNTQENNKLIAEFMGAKPLVLGGSTEYEMYGVLDCIEDGENEKHYFIDDEMRFHESWDWLMSVVKKINSSTDEWGNTNDFMIGNGYVWVDPHIGDRIFFSGNTLEALEEPMISKVYRGVLAFINHSKSK